MRGASRSRPGKAERHDCLWAVAALPRPLHPRYFGELVEDDWRCRHCDACDLIDDWPHRRAPSVYLAAPPSQGTPQWRPQPGDGGSGEPPIGAVSHARIPMRRRL
jgi:hypothetical protein